MKHKNHLFGLVILVLGISILLNILFGFSTAAFFGPALLLILGLYFYQQGTKLVGGILFLVGIIVFSREFLHIDIAGFLIALIFIYTGYRLLVDQKKHKRRKQKKQEEPAFEPDLDKEFDREFEEAMGQYSSSNTHTTNHSAHDQTATNDHTTFTMSRSSLIGDFKLTDQRFELKHSKFSNGIGDMTIDLSKAIILQEQTNLQLSGMIGDITLYVPYDLDVFVEASVTVGDLEVLGYKQGGINRKVKVKSNRYDYSTKKVYIDISLLVGDVSVRYI
ncbi:cell wall-active antibiotics response protein [Bacillaceae bacterium SIJ1]|uniref:cell wall-active antibiotics response protein LiaF n=1 Tax=Litoribacterium kuwaitense TaxID=1398745 RepID=UPI0013EAA2D4|nr:cell wall-active antibiotics response protein LiaF [Litoribacterium kuwaitense]NGP46353.1 cell wall-active antibiotics response protein [Litoribacterium kuwaitense]